MSCIEQTVARDHPLCDRLHVGYCSCPLKTIIDTLEHRTSMTSLRESHRVLETLSSLRVGLP